MDRESGSESVTAQYGSPGKTARTKVASPIRRVPQRGLSTFPNVGVAEVATFIKIDLGDRPPSKTPGELQSVISPQLTER